jgi:hypothetical protein
MKNVFLFEEFNLFKPKPLDEKVKRLIEDIKSTFNIENLSFHKEFEDRTLTQTLEYVYKGQNVKVERWDLMSPHNPLWGWRFYINNENLRGDTSKKLIKNLWGFLSEKWSDKNKQNRNDKLDRLLNTPEDELINKKEDPYGEENWL